MPVGIHRYNDHGRHPNDRIGFITPLKGPDEEIARDVLNRIAAKVVPIMKKHGMDVMSLEEFEPNKEFVGRNWNAGENVELVLKSLSGKWLPFTMVQNVMLHELSHIRSMTHGPLFWKTYNILKKEMVELDARGYTGEGFYSRPYSLGSAVPVTRIVAPEEVPETLCGGSWQRQRRRRRKTGGRKKKFKGEGVALGEDEGKRRLLENGKVTGSKPRVAKSKRSRDLRAEAAMKRFNKQQTMEKVEEEESGSETESEEDEEITINVKPEDDDEEAKRRMNNELRDLMCATNEISLIESDETASEEDEDFNISDVKRPPLEPAFPQVCSDRLSDVPSPDAQPKNQHPEVTCRVCTTCHSPPAPICCEACGNVLQPEKLTDDATWLCMAQGCHGNELGYVNSADAGLCGICGTRRRG